MSHFFERLRDIQTDRSTDERRWIYVPYDQLSDQIGPLSRLDPAETGIVMVETRWKGDRRPYHRQKLAWILANQRHFALEQARRGVAVHYLTGARSYGAMLSGAVEELALDELRVMEPAERELRRDLAHHLDDGTLKGVEHEGWLTSREQFVGSQGGEGADALPWRMDAFYRRIRRDTGILMEEGSPVGGQYSHDGDNREYWPGEPPAPEPPLFEPDEITREVGELIEEHFDHHPGRLDLQMLPATAEDAERAWRWALEECMEHFGPFEDAMSTDSRTLFHTRISPLLNLHRLLPERVLEDVVALDIPVNSKEGFVRQVLGWREFMRHVHRETDGFRELPEGAPTVGTDSVERREGRQPEVEPAPGDGGWGRWRGESWARSEDGASDEALDGGAAPNFLEANTPLPPAFWGEPSGLRCLDTVVEGVLEEGWSHHIERLMVLSNIATLLDVDPRELTDWFWVAYIDAFDWVVEPNVLGMGTFGLGALFVTKPYVSGSNYIDKMSDFCGDCRFDPGKDCPLKSMYWAFLARHEGRLSENRRMGLMMGNLRRRSEDRRARDREIFETTRDRLLAGKEVRPEDV